MRVTLHVTRRCNLQCTYCYADCETVKPAEPASDHAPLDMSRETALKGVELAFEGDDPVAHIGFFGGEPTLRLDLIREAAAYATQLAEERGKQVSFEMTTNGTRVGDEVIELIHQYQMIVAVSIDGNAAAHNTHRKQHGGGDSFARIDRNLDKLLTQVPWLMSFSVVTPQTVPHLADSVDYLLNKGFRVLVAWPDQSANWQSSDLAALRVQMQRVADIYIRHTDDGRKFFLSSIDGAIRSHIRGGSPDCGAGEAHLSVGPSGKIYPCVQFVGDESDDTWVLGNVRDGMAEPHRSERISGLKPSSPECGDCAIETRCGSACPCANLTATGRPDRVSPIQCALQQITVPIADKAAAKLYRRKQALFIHKHYNDLYPVAHCIEATMTRKQA